MQITDDFHKNKPLLLSIELDYAPRIPRALGWSTSADRNLREESGADEPPGPAFSPSVRGLWATETTPIDPQCHLGFLCKTSETIPNSSATTTNES